MWDRYQFFRLWGSPAITVVLACLAGCKAPASQGSTGSPNPSDKAHLGEDASAGVFDEANGGVDASVRLNPQASASPPQSAKASTVCPEYPWGITAADINNLEPIPVG